MQCRRGGAGDETGERAVPGRALPEHPEQERREQRRVHEREDELQHVHDVVELRRDVRRQHRRRDAEDGRHAADPQVVRVARLRLQVRLIDVVRPHGVERRHVARHPRHEAGEQRGQAEAEHSGRKVTQQQRRDREVVIELRLTKRIEHQRCRALVHLERHDAAMHRERDETGQNH